MGGSGDQQQRSGAKVDRSQSCKIDKKDPKVRKHATVHNMSNCNAIGTNNCVKIGNALSNYKSTWLTCSKKNSYLLGCIKKMFN
jgi:hypothetical protein